MARVAKEMVERAGVNLDQLYEGKVYDVSGSFLWKGGKHQVLHQAGQDLTEVLKDAPHGPELLKRFRVVGTINEK